MGDLEMSKRALRAGADIDRKERDVATLGVHGPFGVAGQILEIQKNPPNLPDFGSFLVPTSAWEDKMGFTPLHLAVRARKSEVIRRDGTGSF